MLPFKFFDTHSESTDNTGYDERLSDAKRYIKDHLGFNITCKQVAQHCYLSVKQLSRIFVKYEGMTLMKYITKAKTEAAEELVYTSFNPTEDDVILPDESDVLVLSDAEI